MNKKGTIGVGTLFILFMGVIVAVVLIQQIASPVGEMTTKQSVANEFINLSTARLLGNGGINITSSNYTLANAPTGWKVSNCPLTVTAWGNATADLTENTDYVLYGSSGVLQILNTSATFNSSRTSNLSYVDYTYCGDGYITDSAGRSVASIILIMTALALVAFAVYYAAKEYF